VVRVEDLRRGQGGLALPWHGGRWGGGGGGGGSALAEARCEGAPARAAKRGAGHYGSACKVTQLSTDSRFLERAQKGRGHGRWVDRGAGVGACAVWVARSLCAIRRGRESIVPSPVAIVHVVPGCRSLSYAGWCRVSHIFESCLVVVRCGRSQSTYRTVCVVSWENYINKAVIPDTID
jgi:hypothetical protein